MLKKITETTATYGLGSPPGRRLHRILSGPYNGRQVALMLTSASELKYSYADAPYLSWSTPVSISTGLNDAPFDSYITDNGDIHVAYTTETNLYLETRKLTFSSGSWSVGSAVTIFNVNPCANPSIAGETGGKLWVAWSRDVSGTKTLCAKSSSDDGATWGTGSTDTGDVLTAGSSAVYPKLLIGATRIDLVYVDGISSLLYRSRAITDSNWGSADTVASGSTLDSHFDAAISGSGLLGVVYDQAQLNFREYDGSNWGAVEVLDNESTLFPQIIYVEAVPFVIYYISESSEQLLAKQTSRSGGSFAIPQVLDSRSSYFDSITLYDSSAAAYSDQTANGASGSTADFYHPSSGRIIDAAGDLLYLGGDRKFRYLYIILSTVGSGGTLSYSYFDGINWKAFAPSGGAFGFDSAEKRLLLWDDFDSVPSDWQKNTVNGSNRYWVRIEVISSFTTAPIGTQLTSISDIHSISVRR
ncbi:MAG: hypothetical protein P1R58_05200 [bacterium]|nr:hypothetical protein [bacterium]